MDDGTNAWGCVEVEAITIDQMSAEYGPPSLLFIDVEGFECHALRGAAETLLYHRPDCFVEVHITGGLEKFGSMNELLAFFPPEIYTLYRLTPDNSDAIPLLATQEELRVAAQRFHMIAVPHG